MTTVARRSTVRWLAATLLGFAAAIGLVLWLIRPTFDLAYFLPVPVSEQESVLVERLGQGAGAKLVFIEIESPPGVSAPELSARLRDRLAGSPLFLRVENGQRELSLESIPEPLWRWRYLLADVDWSEAGLARALAQRVDDLATLGGPEVSRLIARDPAWAALRVLERLQLGGADAQPRWSDGDARAFLVTETAAAPFDMAGQQAAIDALRGAWRDLAGTDEGLELFGVGVYGARVQALIQSEAGWLGVLATAVVLCIVSWAYRSWRLTLMSVIPLASAVLGGLLSSSLVFGRIHGITVAFGATLVGVVDDYPMHLFSHARHLSPRESVRVLWRTMFVSAGTAMVAYAALVVSGSRGLAQLGVFSLAGIVCAMAVTCWVLPHLMPATAASAVHDDTPQEFQLSPRVWLPLLLAAGAGLLWLGGPRWNDNLGEMTPLPAALLARDHEMRTRFGAPDVRHIVSVTGDSAEAALERTEALEAQLGDARDRGLIASWSTATTLLPSAAVQERRRAAIPPPAVLAGRLAAASAGLPFRAGAFGPFLADAAAARTLPAVTMADLGGGFIGDYVAGHLSGGGKAWRSVIYLTGLTSPEKLGAWLTERGGGAELVDLKGASESLVRGYRVRLTSILGVALALIAALVLWHTGGVHRFLWSAGTVAASCLFTLAVVQVLHGAVSLFHMVSLVLVAGLGVDYCLFYSRPDVSRTEFQDTRHSLMACASSTAAAFAILGASSIPLLSTIGTTVAVGTFTLLLAARAGCRAL